MTNEEIRTLIHQKQETLHTLMETTKQMFVLNDEIYKCKQEICCLQKQCSHVNTNHELQTENGYCIYCGRKL